MADKIREKLRTGDAKVEHKVNQRSKAWDRFGQIVLADDTITDYVICLSCETLYKYDGHKTGTSNLNRHLCSGSMAPLTRQPTQQSPSKQPLVSSFMKKEAPGAAKSEPVDGLVDLRCSRDMADKIREKLRTGDARVQRKMNRRSKVWERFGQVVLSDDTITGYVICFSCDTLYKYDGHKTGTSNLNRHSCSGSAGLQTRKQLAPPYQPLVSAFIKNEVTSAVKTELVDEFVDFCRSDLGSFGVGSSERFTHEAQGLINIGAHYGAVDAHTVIPHRQTICDRTKEQANKDKAGLCRTINKALEYGLGITTSIWTDSSTMRSYTVLMCHFITDDWKLLSREISTLEFNSTIKQTATNIKEQIRKQLLEVGISADGQSKVVFVSDQGPDIKAALEGYAWVPCTAHVISTVLKHTFAERDAPDFMQELTDQIVKCKNLVTYLKKSGSAFSLPHAGLQESETRLDWTSKAVMLRSVAKKHTEILALLRDKGQEHHMEGIQVEVLNTLVDFLSPFEDALEDMESDSYPTIHRVLLWHHKLRGHCEPRCSDPRYMQHIRSRAGVLLNEEFAITPTHKIATFLSPCFKTLKMLPTDERSAVQAEARRLTAALIPTLLAQAEQTSRAPLGETSASSIPSKEALEEASLKRPRLFSEWEEAPGVIEPDEVQRYLQTHFTVDESPNDILDFWRDHRSTFPLLSTLARAVLCIPATSASSECAFSSKRTETC